MPGGREGRQGRGGRDGRDREGGRGREREGEREGGEGWNGREIVIMVKGHYHYKPQSTTRTHHGDQGILVWAVFDLAGDVDVDYGYAETEQVVLVPSLPKLLLKLCQAEPHRGSGTGHRVVSYDTHHKDIICTLREREERTKNAMKFRP